MFPIAILLQSAPDLPCPPIYRASFLSPKFLHKIGKITWKKFEEYNYFELWLESRDVGQARLQRSSDSLVGPMIAPIISLISSTASMLRPAGGDHLLFNMLVKVRSHE